MRRANPTPWELVGQTIRDANGDVVVSAINPCDMKTRKMIVAAVNARKEREPKRRRCEMKAANLKDSVDRLLEMSEFFKDSDPTLALELRNTASRVLDFVAYREYLARAKDGETGGASHRSRNGEREACARA